MSKPTTSIELMRSVRDFIVNFKTIYGGCSPTLRECCEYVESTRGGSCSTSYMVFLLEQMEEKGMIVRLGDLESRNIAVPGHSWRREDEK